jgi:hypothetical protein
MGITPMLRNCNGDNADGRDGIHRGIEKRRDK